MKIFLFEKINFTKPIDDNFLRCHLCMYKYSAIDRRDAKFGYLCNLPFSIGYELQILL